MRKRKWLSVGLIVLMLVSIMLPSSAVFAATAKSNITIETTLQDNITQKASKKTIDVIARAGGQKVSSEVFLNDEPVKVNWSDTDKDSYTLNFEQEGENIVRIRAYNDVDSAEITRTVNYVPAAEGEPIGYATFCVEVLTIGEDYLIEPVQVPIYEGENAAQVLVRLLEENGYSYSNTGRIESGFYLETIGSGGVYKKGCQTPNDKLSFLPAENPNIPDFLQKHLEDNWFNIGDNWNTDKNGLVNGLGEFDYTFGSGWMYSVNHVFPNVGFADTYLSDGDVVRTQFTLAYGSDIGGASSMGSGESGYYPVADKTELLRYIAQVNSGTTKELMLSDPEMKAAYDQALALAVQLDADEDEVIVAADRLSQKMDEFEQQVEQANAVETMIAAIGEVSLEKAGTVADARAAYEALRQKAKEMIGADTLKVLESAEAKIAELTKAAEDQAAANAVVEQIQALSEITDLRQKEAVEAARAAYDTLTEVQKTLVNEDVLKVLTDAEAKILALQEAENTDKAVAAQMEEQIASIGEVTLDKEGLILTARAIYDALTDAQKERVSNVDVLETAEKALTERKAPVNALLTGMEALGNVEDLLLTDGQRVAALRTAYDALAEDQQNYLSEALYQKLTDSEERIAKLEKEADDAAKAEVVNSLIGDLPETIALEDAAAVKAARTAYDTLTEAQKDLVAEDVLKVLTDAEKAIAELEKEDSAIKAEAKAVQDKIDAIGEVSIDKAGAVAEARAAYEALRDAAKGLISADTLGILESAEARIAELAKAEEDQAAANAVAEQIQALGEITDLRQKEAVEAARAAYDNLTEAQRAYISADTLSVLTAAEAKIAELEKPAKPDPEDKPNPDDKPNPGDKPNPDDKPNPGDKPNPPADPDKDKPAGSKPPKADGGNDQVSGTETENGTIPSGDKADGQGDKASSGKEQPVTPKTGDSQDMGMWMTLMAMAGLGTVIAVRRKTEK